MRLPTTPSPHEAPRPTRRTRAAWAGHATVIALLGVAGDASAQGRPSFSWVRLPGAESCTSSQALAALVEARVGHRVFVPPADADLAIEGRVERTAAPEGWRVVVRAARGVGDVGAREIRSEAPDCAAIDARTALVVSLLIDGAAGELPSTTPPPPTPAAPPVCPACPAPQPPAPAVRVDASAAQAPQLVFHVGGGVHGAFAPDAAVGGGGGVWRRLGGGAWGFGASALGWWAPGDEASGSLAGVGAAAGVTWSPSSSPWLRLGLNLVGGLTHAPKLSDAWAPWVGAQATAGAAWAVSQRGWVGVTANVTAPIVAPQWSRAQQDGSSAAWLVTPWVGAGVDLWVGVAP